MVLVVHSEGRVVCGDDGGVDGGGGEGRTRSSAAQDAPPRPQEPGRSPWPPLFGRIVSAVLKLSASASSRHLTVVLALSVLSPDRHWVSSSTSVHDHWSPLCRLPPEYFIFDCQKVHWHTEAFFPVSWRWNSLYMTRCQALFSGEKKKERNPVSHGRLLDSPPMSHAASFQILKRPFLIH